MKKPMIKSAPAADGRHAVVSKAVDGATAFGYGQRFFYAEYRSADKLGVLQSRYGSTGSP